MTYPTRYERTNGRFPSLFDDLFRDEFFNRFFGMRPTRAGEAEVFAPPVDIKETDKAFVITVDLPGVDRNDIRVNVDRGVLSIQAERKTEETREGENWHLTERRFGVYQRSFRLPETVDADKVEARHRNGVLELTLPKSERAMAKQIEIKE